MPFPLLHCPPLPLPLPLTNLPPVPSLCHQVGDRLSSSSPDVPSASLPAPAPHDSTALLPPFSPPSPSPSSDGEGPTRRTSRTATGQRGGRDTREREGEREGRGWEQLQHYVDATMDLAHHAFPGKEDTEEGGRQGRGV